MKPWKRAHVLNSRRPYSYNEYRTMADRRKHSSGSGRSQWNWREGGDNFNFKICSSIWPTLEKNSFRRQHDFGKLHTRLADLVCSIVTRFVLLIYFNFILLYKIAYNIHRQNRILNCLEQVNTKMSVTYT